MNIKKKNRLSEEKSPYLLQHAENPVDWYPWAAEAFDKAEKRDVPIFLSIGYSVCHWCHVMAHESFEDEEVASILNENFISIKIDREERPDIDAVYMSFCQAMTGSGGWPLTIIMTPDRKPFFAGTYLPKHSRYGSFGLIELLTAVKEKWTDDRSSLISQSEQVLAYIAKSSPAETDSPEDPEKLIHAATSYFRHTFDPVYGGFGHSPKFPSPHNLFFLLNQSNDDCTAMAEKTLIQMYRGGIFDHIAGGFSRYSTDAKWLVPHFEKMLYDNALLLFAYAQAEKITGKKLYGKIADKIAHYIAGELTHPGGGFYCGQDADSDGVEGKYYVFTPEEIDQVLGEDEGREFCLRYDITAEGNFEGKSIPNLLKTETFDEFSHEETLEKLSQYRSERTSLHKDDKILTGWNGLMIAALAYAARTLDRQDYMESARKAAAFICNHLHLENGQLLKRWRKGQADFDGTLEDYAYFTWGLLECYSSTFDETYLKLAVMTGKQMLTQFFDEENGGCYLYAKDSEQLILRPKETYDGALPSGNSAAALVMRKLAFFSGENIWQQAWNKQSAFLQREAAEHPAGQSFFLWQLTDELSDRGQLICVSKAPAVHKELWKLNMDVLVKTEENAAAIAEIAPFLNDYPIPESGASYYYCQGHTCRPPVDSLEKITGLNR